MEDNKDKVDGGVTKPNSSGNLDELTLRQQEAIETEISTTIPLISHLEPLSNLAGEYLEDGVYLKKITTLSLTYPHYRRTRPDGNCFYRAFSFGILEHLIKNPAQQSKFKSNVMATKSLLNNQGFNQFTVDDFYDTFLDLVEKTVDISIQDLESEFHQPSLADYLVVYLRIVTSAVLRSNSEFYQNFIEEKTVEEFCSLEVEPMYKESDHIHIIGLCEGLGVRVRVLYVDRGTDAQHTFPSEDEDTDNQFIITLLYRPGHYDLIYGDGDGAVAKETSEDVVAKAVQQDGET